MIFGPNNAGKTRLLHALANGLFEADISGPTLAQHDVTISRFPGPDGAERWTEIEPLVVTWQRNSRSGSLSANSLNMLKRSILSHLPREQLQNLNNLVRKLVKVVPFPPAHFVRTNRFIPSHASIEGSPFQPNDLVPGTNELDSPERMTTALADLHDSPDEHLRERFENIRCRFQDIVGVSLSVRRAGSRSFLQVDDGHVARSLEESGDGLRDLLGLLLHLECIKTADLFIDDPGIRLHPGAQRKVLSVLEQEALTRAIWIATHDSVFVAARSAVARYAVARKDGQTHVSALTDLDHARSAIREVGWLPGDVFVADTLVCCEGPSDKVVFGNRVLEERLAKYSGTVVTDLGGAGMVWGNRRADLLRLATVARVSVAHGRVVALLDRDRHSTDEVESLKRELNSREIGFYCLSRPELEDYWLMSSSLLHVILVGLAQEGSVRSGNTVSPPSQTEVSAFLSRAPTEAKASKLIEELCDSHFITWSKELAARIAISKIDEVAPEVAAAITEDLDRALAAAIGH